MDHIDCYITIHIEESDLKKIKQYVGTPMEFIDKQGTDIQQLITSRLPQQHTSYLVWDQLESVLLVNPATSSTRYQLDNENDKEALSSHLSAFNITSSTQQQESTLLPGKAKATKYALYLDLPSLQLNESHLKVLRQVIVDSIQDHCSLTVLLNTASITTRPQETALWSIQTEKQWKEWQTLLGLLYMTQVQVAYSQGSPLFDMTVMILPLLGDDYMVSGQLDFDTLFAVHYDIPILNAWNTRRQSIHLAPFPIRTIESSQQNGIKNNSSDNKDGNTQDHQLQRFSKVVVGGTFDHLHAGHKILLTMTALSSTKAMIVGVTDDVMLLSKKHSEWLESTEQRIQRVRQFCNKIRPDMAYEVVPIYDPYGPTITDPTIDALVCSQETLKGGHMVNDERQKRDYSILALRVIDVISATSDSTLGNEANMADKISSTWIRNYLADKTKGGCVE